MFAALFLSAVLLGQQPAVPEPDLQLSGAHVLRPDGGGWLEGHVVSIGDGRILAITAGGASAAEGVPTLDASGLYLVPGLIDLHSHLLLHPYDEASWNEQVMFESLGLRTLRAVGAARSTLRAGFTTLRELGTEGAGVADVALRDAITAGLIEGPRVLTATKALAATGCYGVAGLDPRWQAPAGAQIADGPLGLRRAVREQIAAGADWIKVYADYRRRPGAPSTPTFSAEELAAVVDEARTAGVPVAAHASTDAGIRRALAAGVQTIEHGTQASRETLEAMREAGVALCPTLAAAEAIARYSGWSPGQPEHARIRSARETFARAVEVGVVIACGSDVGVFSHGDNAREIELMAAWGLGPEGALRAATSTAAEVIGRGDELGRIAPGYRADLIALRADPLADAAHLREPVLVLKDGRPVFDERGKVEDGERRELVGLVREFLTELSELHFERLRERFAPGAVVVATYPDDERPARMESVAELVEHGSALAGRRVHERLAGEPTVLVDGDVACVWARYELELDERRFHGVDVFQLARIEGAWRIVSLTYTNTAR